MQERSFRLTLTIFQSIKHAGITVDMLNKPAKEAKTWR